LQYLLRHQWRAAFQVDRLHLIRSDNPGNKPFVIEFVIEIIKKPFLLFEAQFHGAHLFFILFLPAFQILYLFGGLEIVEE
jgi:hypothetical protein